jgi:hypothetical protein
MDKLNTHTPGSLYEAFAPEEAKAVWDRFEVVYTPKHGSWLNMAETEIDSTVAQCLDRHNDRIETMRSEAAAWQSRRVRPKSTGSSPPRMPASSSNGFTRQMPYESTLRRAHGNDERLGFVVAGD